MIELGRQRFDWTDWTASQVKRLNRPTLVTNIQSHETHLFLHYKYSVEPSSIHEQSTTVVPLLSTPHRDERTQVLSTSTSLLTCFWRIRLNMLHALTECEHEYQSPLTTHHVKGNLVPHFELIHLWGVILPTHSIPSGYLMFMIINARKLPFWLTGSGRCFPRIANAIILFRRPRLFHYYGTSNYLTVDICIHPNSQVNLLHFTFPQSSIIKLYDITLNHHSSFFFTIAAEYQFFLHFCARALSLDI